MSDVPTRMLALLADEIRRRVFAAIALGARDQRQAADWAHVTAAQASRAVARLETVGLVRREADGLVVCDEPFAEAARTVGAAAKAARAGNVDSGPADRTLSHFVHGGRLERMPVQRAKRMVVLEYLANLFEHGVDYPEREINERLGGVNHDYATLRRSLVDEGFFERHDGVYRRLAGPDRPATESSAEA